MSKEIEEMAKAICCLNTSDGCFCDGGYCNYNCLSYEKAENLYKQGYRKQEWINVEERLPDHNEYDWVLVNVAFDEDGSYGVPQPAEYRNGEWFGLGDFHSMGDLYCTVTHWMPIPAPPKGGEG